MQLKSFYRLVLALLITVNLGVSQSNAQVGNILWEDNFNSFDTTTWNTIIGNGCAGGINNCGWGNHELEYYQQNNLSIEEIPGEPGNYALVIEARKESIGGSSFTSGKVSTENKLAVKYGMIEVRMKVPEVATGLWPAAWLLGTSFKTEGWPGCGEMDMMEMGQKAQFRSDKHHAGSSPNNFVGANLIWYHPDACSENNPTCAANIAFDNYYCTPYVAAEPINERFLIYRMYWDSKEIRLTVEDNGEIRNFYTGPFPISSESTAFTKPYFLILNLAVGGDFTDAANASQVTAAFPGKLYIDYIKVRKWNGQGEVATSSDLLANAGTDKSINEGDPVTLDASSSFGNIASYLWTEGNVTLSTSMKPTLNLTPGTHNITLTITDATGKTASDKVTVQVGINQIGEVIWEDNFNSFNADLWNKSVGNGCETGNCGWGNGELEYYKNENVYVEEISGDPGNFALVLEAKKETIETFSFSSGKVTTENKVAIKYGVVEVRMKVPNLENGLWPAAWLLGTNQSQVGWPDCGEIDMMEMGQSADARAKEGYPGVSVNRFTAANLLWYSPQACSPDNQTCAASIAYDSYYNTPYVPATGMNNRFVTYRMYWDDKSIRFTVIDNGVEHDLYTGAFPIGTNEAAFQKPFYFLLDLAVGGRFTGVLNNSDITAPFPAKMYIDYVKVSKWKGKGEVAFSGGNILANAGTAKTLTDLDRNGSESVILDGSLSYGNITSYEWSEGGAVLATGEKPTLNLSDGTHTITLTVKDADGKTSTDKVVIDVREIIWEENFNSYNSSSWNAIEGDGCASGANNCGWGNHELENYQTGNISVADIAGEPGNKALVLQAKKETIGSSSFTSGKITTENKVNVRYGLIEVRMKAPEVATGLWPAAWLLGSNQSEVGWPYCGEIDMMEMGQKAKFRTDNGFSGASANNVVGGNLIFYTQDACSAGNPTCAASIAADNYYCTPYNASAPLNERYVIYRTYWNEYQIRLTVEDEGVERDFYTGPFPIGETSLEFQKPFYFLLNLAVGGDFTDAANATAVTAPLPANMMVDYVRVMKWNGKGEVAFASGLIANAGADAIVIDKNSDKTEEVVLDGSGSVDQNGEIVNYSWSIDGTEIATGVNPHINLGSGSHTILLTVTDNDGNSATDEVNFLITSGGASPVANAGADTTVYDNDGDDYVLVHLDGSGSSDPKDSPLTYSWLENNIEIATGMTSDISLKTGIHTITLVVTNDEELTGSDVKIITVIDPDNIPPIADAGNDQVLNDVDGDDMVTVQFDASGSSDSDGIIDSYSWRLDNGQIATGETANVELSTGSYQVVLVVTDNDGISSSDTVSITIIDPDNIPPVAVAGNDTIIIDTDKNGSASFVLDGSGSSDVDGTIDTYNWFENGLKIGTGVQSTIQLGLGAHSIVLVVTDDDNVSNSDTILVKVNQLPVANAGADIIISDENRDGHEDVVLDASSSSDPDGNIVQYSWKENGLEIANGVNANHNFSWGTHVVTLIVTDNDGFNVTDQVLVIVVNPDNSAPVADAGDDIEVADEDLNGYETVSLNGSGSYDSDGSIFSYSWIENNIEISSEANPELDFEVGVHTIILKVTDNMAAVATDTIVVTVKAGPCILTPCTGDFTVRVESPDASNTTVTFVPTIPGTGDNLLLFYYGTDLNSAWGANTPKPYKEFKINGVTAGQTVYFYYTYNLSTGGEQNTSNCKQSFVVGSCYIDPNSAPIANAGPDQTISDVDGNGEESVDLDGSTSYDSDGTISNYTWKEGNKQLASSKTATVVLPVGNHTIQLRVIDDKGKMAEDAVSIKVEAKTATHEVDLTKELTLYPIPVSDVLHIKSSGTIHKIIVYNALGAKAIEVSEQSQIDVSSLENGLYLVEIIVDKTSIIKKMVKE